MISKKQAQKKMLDFDQISLSTHKSVNLAITNASSTGNQSVTFFYEKKTAARLKKLLRSKGFYLETITFQSAADQELITVVWDTSILSGMERSQESE